MKTHLTRRRFLETTSLAGATLTLGMANSFQAAEVGRTEGKPAALGGQPVCSGGFPGWPVFDETEERALHETLHSGQWYRGSGKAVAHFEDAYAKLTGAKHCLATSCGTSALTTTLGAL